MTKKKDGFFDNFSQKFERRAKRSAKSKTKGLHILTKLLITVFLLLGIGIGALVCTLMSKNDRFVLKGETQFSIEAGTTYIYEEDGIEAVAFGLNCADKVKVTASRGITKNADGHYVIPAEEGVYTLTYTVDNLKFGGKLGGEKIQRIRTFTVDASEEDDRNG